MRCPACGQDNKPENIFCAKCLEMLTKKRLTAVNGQRVVAVPPQNEHLVDISYYAPTPPASHSWVWVVTTLVLVSILVGLLYVFEII